MNFTYRYKMNKINKIEVVADIIDLLYDNPDMFPIVNILKKTCKSNDEVLFHLRHSIGINQAYNAAYEAVSKLIFIGGEERCRKHIIRLVLALYVNDYHSKKLTAVPNQLALKEFFERNSLVDNSPV